MSDHVLYFMGENNSCDICNNFRRLNDDVVSSLYQFCVTHTLLL